MRNEIDRSAMIGFLCIGTQDSPWLEQQNVDHGCIGSNGVPRDHNVVLLRVDPGGERIDDVSIDVDVSGKNQFFACSP